MRILILEDNLQRIEKFKVLFKNQSVDVYTSTKEAKCACLLNNYDVLWLDHDLEGKFWVDSSEENTGYQFVRWLVDNGYMKKALIYIHSMNPVGANRMLNYLKDNTYDGIWIPFNTLKIGE